MEGQTEKESAFAFLGPLSQAKTIYRGMVRIFVFSSWPRWFAGILAATWQALRSLYLAKDLRLPPLFLTSMGMTLPLLSSRDSNSDPPSPSSRTKGSHWPAAHWRRSSRRRPRRGYSPRHLSRRSRGRCRFDKPKSQGPGCRSCSCSRCLPSKGWIPAP